MEWQPIETAPKDGTRVFVFANGRLTEAWFCSETGLWPHDEPYSEEGEPCNVGMPTHWMPLPKAPNQTPFEDPTPKRIARVIMAICRGVSTPTLDRLERTLGITVGPPSPDAGKPYAHSLEAQRGDVE